MSAFHFDPIELPPEAEAVRHEVRAFLDETLADYPPALRGRSWSGFDPEFSRKLGQAGYIGMTFPKEYGGHGRSAFERYAMLEEVLAAGAPVAAHWTADRQSGPLLVKFGTEKMKREIVSAIAAGECFFCIGMSEPDSGSDLASIRTRATRTDDGWLVNGTKVWTSGAHLVDYMIALVRTDPQAEKKHEGMSQLLIDVRNTPGLTVRPIRNLAGEEHFNEVVFEDALVPAENLIGTEGQGWAQVVAELAFERSGPGRYMSSFELIKAMTGALSQDPPAGGAAALGRLVAHMTTLRAMSVSVAGMLNDGADPALEGSIIKDLGAVFEQSVPLIAHQQLEREPSPHQGDDVEQVLAYVTQAAPSFSLRGGTREILRGIIARGLGLR